MKNGIRGLAIGLIVCLATVGAFAWVLTQYRANVGFNVTPESKEAQLILKCENKESAQLNLSDLTVPFATTEDGVNFTDKDNKTVTVPKKEIVVKTTELSTLKLEKIECTDDSLNQALRISIYRGNKAKTIKPTDTNVEIGEFSAGTETITIRVWYEGTDSACTNANYVKSNGTNIKLYFCEN